MRPFLRSGLLSAAALLAGWLAGRQYWPHHASGTSRAPSAPGAAAAGAAQSPDPAAEPPPKPQVSKKDLEAAVKAAREDKSENALRDAARRMALEPPPALTDFLEAAADSGTVRTALRDDAVYWAFCRNPAAGLAQISAVAAGNPVTAQGLVEKALLFFPPKDLPVVLKWYQTLPAGDLRYAALAKINRVLARKNFAQAVALTASLPDSKPAAAPDAGPAPGKDEGGDGGTGGDGSPAMTAVMATGTMSMPGAAPESSRNSGGMRLDLMATLLNSFEGSPEEVRAKLELFPAGDRDYLKSRLQARDFANLYNGDREGAASALAEMPEAERKEKGADFFSGWADNDPIRAAKAIEKMPEASRSPEMYSALARKWAEGNVGSSSAWVDSLPPGPLREAASQGLVQGLSKNYPAEALTWAATVGDAAERTRLMRSVLTGASPEKRAGLAPVIESLTLTPEEKLTLRNALQP